MSDVFPTSTQSSTPGIVYTVSTQYVKDFSFENPRAPHIFAQAANQAPQVSVSVSVAGQKLSDTLYEIVLDITAEAKQGDDVVFLAELSYAGVVLARDDVPQTHLEPLLMIEVPRMLFPFARAILSSATRDGGFPPLLLAPVNFEALYEHQKAAAAEKTETPA
jgi:preprotein translocase subunit SecB